MHPRIFVPLAVFLTLFLLTGCGVAIKRSMIQPMMERAIAEAPTTGQTEVVVTLVPKATETGQPTRKPAATAAAATVKSTSSGEDIFAQAVANIRTLTGLPDLQLTPVGNQSAPNASLYPAVAFDDEMGNTYYAYQENQRVIEFTLVRTPDQSTPGPDKTEDELRALALEYARKYSINFEKYQKLLTYTEGPKDRGNHFYRWEIKNTDVGNMPALIQIGLKSDGRLFGYLNSLDLMQLSGVQPQ